MLGCCRIGASSKKLKKWCGRSDSVFQNIRNQMNEEFKKLRKKFDDQAKIIINKETALEKQKSILDSKAYSEKIAEIEKSKKNIQAELEKDKQKLQKIYFDTINDINKKMNSMIEKLANEKSYYAIFEASTLIYNNLDNITDETINIMNAEIPNYEIKFDVENKK
jgi:Skp family chaperone for outer membrane proteins